VGAILDGRLTVGGVEHDVRPGIAATVTVSWLALPERATRPFVLVAGTASVSTATTAAGAGPEVRLTAVDLRATALVGKTFFDRLTPYLAARVFGGPVMWHIDGADVTGGDQHHFAVGAGATLRLPGRLDLYAEAMPLGERSLNVGAGLSF
jgi:opacity protein-like surface antigen